MAELSLDEITKPVKDILYTAVGLGLLGFQGAQVRRREIEKQVRAQSADARAQLESRLREAEERLAGLEAQVDAMLDLVEDRLPAQAAEMMRQGRSAAKDARAQLRGRLTAA